MRWWTLMFWPSLAGCTYVVPVADTSPKHCIVVAKAANSDTLVVGSYPPPCNKVERDTVMIWRIHFPRECTMIGTFNPNDHRAAVSPSCPEIPDYIEVAF